MNARKVFWSVIYLLSLWCTTPVRAQTSSPGFLPFQAYITDASDNAVPSTPIANFYIEIIDSINGCILYQEQWTGQATDAKSIVALLIGNANGTITYSTGISAPFKNVFTNSVSTGTCIGGGGPFVMAANDGRKISFSIDNVTYSIPIDIGAVPYAYNSEFANTANTATTATSATTATTANNSLQLGGVAAAGYLQTGTAFTGDITGAYNATNVAKLQGKTLNAPAPAAGDVLTFVGGNWINQAPAAGVASVTAGTGISLAGTAANPIVNVSTIGDAQISVGAGIQLSKLAALGVNSAVFTNAGGVLSSAAFLPLAQGGTNASLTGALGKVVVGGGAALAETAVGIAGQVLTSNGAAAPTWGTVNTALGYTPVNKAGDTMTGALNMGTFDITNTGNIAMSASKSLTVSNWVGSDPGAPVAGQMWMRSDTNQLKFYDGTAIRAVGIGGAGLATLNGDATAAQTIASGTNINVANAGSTHTINFSGTLPVANGGTNSTTIGVANTVPYSNGASLVYTPAGINGQVLVMIGGVPTWGNAISQVTTITAGGSAASPSLSVGITAGTGIYAPISGAVGLSSSSIAGLTVDATVAAANRSINLFLPQTSSFSGTVPNLAPASQSRLYTDATGILQLSENAGAYSPVATQNWVGGQNFLPKTGGLMSGAIAMGGNDITGANNLNSNNVTTTNLTVTNPITCTNCVNGTAIAPNSVTNLQAGPTLGGTVNVSGPGNAVGVPVTLWTFIADEPAVFLVNVNFTRITSSTPWGWAGFQLYSTTNTTNVDPAGAFPTYDYRFDSNGFSMSKTFVYNKTTVGAETMAVRWMTGDSSTGGAFTVTVDSWDALLNGWSSNFSVIKLRR